MGCSRTRSVWDNLASLANVILLARAAETRPELDGRIRVQLENTRWSVMSLSARYSARMASEASMAGTSSNNGMTDVVPGPNIG